MEAYVPCSGLESNDFNGCGRPNVPVIVMYMPPSSTTSGFLQPTGIMYTPTPSRETLKVLSVSFTASVTITATSGAGGISSVIEPKGTVNSTVGKASYHENSIP